MHNHIGKSLATHHCWNVQLVLLCRCIIDELFTSRESVFAF